jgi:hypothetical protein
MHGPAHKKALLTTLASGPADGEAEESRLGQSMVHRRRGPISHSGQDVRIRVQRDGDRRVAEKLLHELRVDALR